MGDTFSRRGCERTYGCERADFPRVAPRKIDFSGGHSRKPTMEGMIWNGETLDVAGVTFQKQCLEAQQRVGMSADVLCLPVLTSRAHAPEQTHLAPRLRNSSRAQVHRSTPWVWSMCCIVSARAWRMATHANVRTVRHAASMDCPCFCSPCFKSAVAVARASTCIDRLSIGAAFFGGGALTRTACSALLDASSAS